MKLPTGPVVYEMMVYHLKEQIKNIWRMYNKLEVQFVEERELHNKTKNRLSQLQFNYSLLMAELNGEVEIQRTLFEDSDTDSDTTTLSVDYLEEDI